MNDEAQPLTIRCLVCEEPFDQLEGSLPADPVGGVPVTFDAHHAGIFPTTPSPRLQLRGYLCDECIYAKGTNGLLHLVRTTIEHDYQTWRPRWKKGPA